jgi:tetratricopeptide (TPR) repeat protein
MATLARVDVDVADLPHLQLEDELSHVAARPSREFSAVDPTLEMPLPARNGWLGKTLFVSTMIGIIAAASVTAVRENAREPWLAPWLYSAQRMLPLDEPTARASASMEERSEALAAGAINTIEAEPPSPAAATLLPGLAAPSNERVRLPEVVFVNPEPSMAKQRAMAQRPGKSARGLRAQPKVKPVVHSKAAAPLTGAVAGNWEQAREVARTAYASGRYREALAAYEQAVRLNPRHGLTLAGLAATRMQTGDAAGAVDAYRRAVASAPTNLTFQIALARAYAAAGDDARARDTFARVLKRDRNNVAAQAGLDRL